MTASEVTVSDQWAETWKSAAAIRFSKYEVSADGFGPDQQPVRRISNGKPLAVSLGSNGYLRVKPYDDDGKQQTIDVHSLVLRTYAGPRPDGMECRHLDGDPFNNRWRPGSEAESRAAGGNVIYGTKPENAADQAAAGTAKTPATHPCINHERCGGMVVNPGRRCLPCAQEVGREAAAMLRAGLLLPTVTRRLDYKSPSWVEGLARKYGGFTGPLPQPPQPRPRRQPWPQRVMATVRYRLKIRRSNAK